jgi:hypothetical protein
MNTKFESGIYLKIGLRGRGIIDSTICVDTPEEETAAHSLLAQTAFERRQFDEALRRPPPLEVFQQSGPSDPNDAELTAAVQNLVYAIGSPNNQVVRALLDLCEFRNGAPCACDLVFLSLKDLGFLISSGLITRADDGGWKLNVVRKNGHLAWAGTEE